MKRNTLNFAIDAALGVAMLAMVGTGLLLKLVLPPGSGNRTSLWGWGRHDWGDFHFYMAIVVGAVIVLHVALHWSWVCVTALRCVRRCGEASNPPGTLKRNIAGVALVALLTAGFGAFVWTARLQTQDVRTGNGISQSEAKQNVEDLGGAGEQRHEQRRRGPRSMP